MKRWFTYSGELSTGQDLLPEGCSLTAKVILDRLVPCGSKIQNFRKEWRCICTEVVKRMNCNSFSPSLPSWWQMSSPVGGYLHRKIVEQTSCQKLDRCLWISSIKFKSFSTIELFSSIEKNGLSFTWCFPDPRISSSRQLQHLVNGMLTEERGKRLWPLQGTLGQNQVRSDGRGQKRRKKKKKHPPSPYSIVREKLVAHFAKPLS